MRFPQSMQGDEGLALELDAGFFGVENRREPNALESGLVADAVNMRFDRNQARTRPCYVSPVHANRVTVDAGGEWSEWDWHGGAALKSGGVFSDPNGEEFQLIIAADGIYRCREGMRPMRLLMDADYSFDGEEEIVQVFDRILVFRGAAKPTLYWNGQIRDALSNMETYLGRKRADFVDKTPRADWGVVLSDRVWVPISWDTLAWSDLLDPTAFDLTLGQVRFNSGEDDVIVGAAAYQGNRLAVFKTQSIYILNGVQGNLAAMSVDKLPTRVGCVARRTICAIGVDLIWLGDGGVYRLSQTEQGAVRSEPLPLSYPIPGYMERINWRVAWRSCACVCGRYYYLAVPFDHAEFPNVVLVYDVQSGQWQGYDVLRCGGDSESQIPVPLKILNLFSSEYASQMAPYVVTDRFVVVGNQPGYHDWVGTINEYDLWEHVPIQWSVSTRGYPLGGVMHKRANNARLAYASEGATLSVAVETDGQGERKMVLENKTRTRWKYLRVGKPAFMLNNVNDDFAAPHREDYLWQPSDAVLLHDGIRMDLMQDYELGLPVRDEARWFSVVASGEGSIALLGVQMQGAAEKHHFRSKS